MSSSSKYRIKKKKSGVTSSNATATPKEPPLIGKGKILLILILGTTLVAGIYMAALQMHFAPIIHIYWIITTLLLMAFLFVKMRNESLYAQMSATSSMTKEDIAQHRERTKKMKYLLLVLLPFLFTLFGDLVYLYILKDLDFFDAIKNLM